MLDVSPDRIQTHQLFARQANLKGLYRDALIVSDAYVERAPWTREHFAGIRAVAASRLEALAR